MEKDDYPFELLVPEFEQLREEINNRTRLQGNLVIAALAALAAGVSAVATFPDAPLGVATVISFLWLLWTDHDKQITSLGAYLALEIEPRLRHATGTYSWETFFRDLDEGDRVAIDRLKRHGSNVTDVDGRVPRDRKIVSEFKLIFFWTPVALLVLYGLQLLRRIIDPGADGIDWAGTTVRLTGFVLAIGVLAYSNLRQRQRRQRRETVRTFIRRQNQETPGNGAR